jgi:hypothetical protein
MFLGDRGLGVSSSVNGYRRYGGAWKQIIQGQNTHACITNESGTSQTCLYCFSPLTHPTYNKPYKGQIIKAQVKGSFMCVNPRCILVQQGRAIQPRDSGD